jgi:hypothetical protein
LEDNNKEEVEHERMSDEDHVNEVEKMRMEDSSRLFIPFNNVLDWFKVTYKIDLRDISPLSVK